MQVVESLRGCEPCGRTQVIRLMVAVRFVSLGVLIDGGRARVETEETVVIRTRSVMARRPLTIFAGWVAFLDVPGMLLISVRRCAEYFNVGAGRSVSASLACKRLWRHGSSSGLQAPLRFLTNAVVEVTYILPVAVCSNGPTIQ